jgi:pre-rRNA-processing protein SRD1
MASGNRFDYTNHDEESLPPQDQSYHLDFNDNYGFGDIMPEQGLPPVDLEGRLSNVMLTYDSMPSTGVSMPMSMDAGHSFAYDSYPTTVGMPPQLDQAQLLPAFTPFSQGIQPQVGQYTVQPGAAGPPQRRNELYNDGNNSSGSNLDDSDFSRSSDRSQAQPHTSHRAQQARQPRPLQPSSSAPYRPLQPVAIQPKKPPAIKGEECINLYL